MIKEFLFLMCQSTPAGTEAFFVNVVSERMLNFDELKLIDRCLMLINILLCKNIKKYNFLSVPKYCTDLQIVTVF